MARRLRSIAPEKFSAIAASPSMVKGDASALRSLHRREEELENVQHDRAGPVAHSGYLSSRILRDVNRSSRQVLQNRQERPVFSVEDLHPGLLPGVANKILAGGKVYRGKQIIFSNVYQSKK